MEDLDMERVRTHYRDTFKNFGINDVRSLSWISEKTQKIRYDVIINNVDFNEKRVLDIGCGLGDFYAYLKKYVKKFDYLGIDIVEELIKGARMKYPSANFRLESMFDFNDPSFDCIIANGALSFKLKNNDKTYLFLIKHVFELCRRVFAFNMLDKRFHVDNELFATYIPKEIYDFCKGFCPKAKLIQGYLKHDFTIVLSR